MPPHFSDEWSHSWMRGFTLIELLIVVGILGILALAALSAINPGKRQNLAKDSAIKSDIGQIATALEAFYTSRGTISYPDNLGDLTLSSDLKYLPIPPKGGDAAYSYAFEPAGRDVVNIVCTKAVVWSPLFAGDVAGNIWCWESDGGPAEEESLDDCTDFNGST